MAESPSDELGAALAGDAPAPDKPRRGRPPGSGKKKGGSMSDAALRDGLVKFFGTVGMFAGFANEYDGLIITSKAEELAEAYMTAAARSPAVRRVLESLLTSEGVLTAVIATAGVAVPILANHGRPIAPPFVVMALAGEVGPPPGYLGETPTYPPSDESDEPGIVVAGDPVGPAPRSPGEAAASVIGFPASAPPSPAESESDDPGSEETPESLVS